MKMKQSALFIALFSAIYGTPLAAEEEAKTDRKELEHIEVFGHKISLLNQDVASSISVINEKAIARKQQSEFINILKDLPGVDIN